MKYINIHIYIYIYIYMSNTGDIAFYGRSENIRTRNFTIFTVYATIFRRLTHVFF